MCNKDCTKIYPTLLEIPILGTTFCSFLGFGIWRFDIELFSLVKFLVITNNLCVCLRIGISYIFSDPKKITLSLLDGPRLTVTCIPVVEDIFEFRAVKIWIIMNFYPDTTQISLLKQRVAPFTVLQIVNAKTFSEDFTCKVFSLSIPSSDNWNPLKKSKDSWFRALWRECLCFTQVTSV